MMTKSSNRQRFTLTLGSTGRIRVPGWIRGRALAVRYDDRMVEFVFLPSRAAHEPGRILSLCGPWMRDVFPQGAVGLSGRAAANSRAMLLLFERDGDRWVARIPRDLSWYEENKTNNSRGKDDDARGQG